MAKEKSLRRPRGLLLSVLLLVHVPKTRRGHVSTWLSGNDWMLDFPEKEEERELWGDKEKCHSL